jgi:hypothetical protein
MTVKMLFSRSWAVFHNKYGGYISVTHSKLPLLIIRSPTLQINTNKHKKGTEWLPLKKNQTITKNKWQYEHENYVYFVKCYFGGLNPLWIKCGCLKFGVSNRNISTIFVCTSPSPDFQRNISWSFVWVLCFDIDWLLLDVHPSEYQLLE